MGLMPEWARRMTGTYQSELPYRFLFAPKDRLTARLVRWAYPVLPCEEMARTRTHRTVELQRRTVATFAGISPAL
jgi:hypothetical protein